ncbi:MAG: MAPEG family protein [Hyphomonadaceae bacterium JAD_PAG50586_4]|nr:MAG: MAPEG family protein [Hyphomonadaceae bacterium JAD_PAG50586_4]
MQSHAYVAIVTALALLVYLWTVMGVGAARRKSGIQPPAMTGDPLLERAVRVQTNTLEWLPVFLPSLWLCHLFWQPQDQTGIIVAAIGVVWIVGRILYALGYVVDPSKREMGFLIQFLASIVLLLGALGKAVMVLIAP